MLDAPAAFPLAGATVGALAIGFCVPADGFCALADGVGVLTDSFGAPTLGRTFCCGAAVDAGLPELVAVTPVAGASRLAAVALDVLFAIAVPAGADGVGALLPGRIGAGSAGPDARPFPLGG
jgi:hypothetical protein